MHSQITLKAESYRNLIYQPAVSSNSACLRPGIRISMPANDLGSAYESDLWMLMSQQFRLAPRASARLGGLV
jgi:hypothetical protein